MDSMHQDIRHGNHPDEFKQAILDNLYYTQGKSAELATLNDWYMAVSYTVRDRMMKHWIASLHKFCKKEIKVVGYLSAEFLLGPHLDNAMLNLGIQDEMKMAMRNLGLDPLLVLHQEEEPGLGNGGLGRLAACFMDSLTTLDIPAIGYGIRYEFGIFDQQIKNGEQVEVTDKWIRFGNPWEIIRPELSYIVKFGGHTESFTDHDGNYSVKWIPAYEVKGVAYDTAIPGYRNDSVNILRLWKSEAVESFNFKEFNEGNYAGAVDQKTFAETISKVLYPNDELDAGKRLRLSQQYFFVSCSLRDTLHILKFRGLSLRELPDAFALQLNDTHPSIGIAELMRLLIDEHFLAWEEAWDITRRTFGYTNHTLLPEALEKWSLPLFSSLLPRHLEIIYEINHRFLDEVKIKHAGNEQLLARLSIIDEHGEKYIRMAHLATIGSHMINGVSRLHSDLLRHSVLSDFYALEPEKIVNITNGVTPRRWIKLYNPSLAALISKHIGAKWISHFDSEIIKLESMAGDKDFRDQWRGIKWQNKKDLAELILQRTGVSVNPDSLFDVQVKRIHEYKRQHLNLLHIIALYNRIKKNPGINIQSRTFIFGGKAAPGYFMAKLIIRLINGVANIINDDPDVAGRLKVVFFPDFNVKNSEWLYRAADLSEQISTAGKEASGTGNMKFSMNGALTIGTPDGANVEIMQEVGAENFFLFGLDAIQASVILSGGYQPAHFYQNNHELKEVIDMIDSGIFSNGDRRLLRPVIDSLVNNDPYLVMADFSSYMDCQEKVAALYADQEEWTRKAILNVARMGRFSSDRSIRDYCRKVWGINLVNDVG
jgi:starch phosphorylase